MNKTIYCLLNYLFCRLSSLPHQGLWGWLQLGLRPSPLGRHRRQQKKQSELRSAVEVSTQQISSRARQEQHRLSLDCCFLCTYTPSETCISFRTTTAARASLSAHKSEKKRMQKADSPAVVVPPLSNAGFSLCSAAMVVPSLMPSSFSIATVISFPFASFFCKRADKTLCANCTSPTFFSSALACSQGGSFKCYFSCFLA